MQDSIPQLIQACKRQLPVTSSTSIKELTSIITDLQDRDVNAIELTLRSAKSVDSLQAIRQQFPNLFLCAGSATCIENIKAVAEIGVDAVITPGITRNLLEAAKGEGIDILPGISSASDILLGLEYHLRYFKLFPAEILGGLAFIDALGAPFPDCRFCPSGGINSENFQRYLHHPQVDFVAGSWLIPASAHPSNINEPATQGR